MREGAGKIVCSQEVKKMNVGRNRIWCATQTILYKLAVTYLSEIILCIG